MGKLMHFAKAMFGIEKDLPDRRRELESKKRRHKLHQSDQFELRDIKEAQETEEK
jgi:hypothetical protein